MQKLPLIVVGRGDGSLHRQEKILAYFCGDWLKSYRSLSQVETIREIVAAGIRISQRRQIVNFLNKFQDAAEIVGHVRDVSLFRVRGYDNEGNAKTIFVGIVDGRSDMIVPTAPVVPSNDDGGIRPIGAGANGVDDRCYPRRAGALVA